MATELGQAYVQIMPSARGIKDSISKQLDPEARSAGLSAGSLIGGNLVKMIGGAIAAAGIGKMISSALSAGADLQQSFGGIDTLYKGAETAVKGFAKEAYKAGISANTYAEQAVSMGASLKQSLGGDAVAAAKAANMAIMDMADNSAKMGTDITSIQMAYQGFAKQNYTMLDNLKLGYGGTKEEMKRLLSDAEKLPAAMGKKFDLSNYADVVEAIHLVQDNMGIAGVAAEEAKTTFSGSLAAMKSSFTNVLAGLSLGDDIRPALRGLAETTSNFLFGNFIPMVANIFKGLPSAIGTFIGAAAPIIASQFQGLMSSLGISIDLSPITAKFAQIGQNLQPVFNGLKMAFSQLPSFFTSIGSAVAPVIDTIISGLARLDFSGFEALISAILPALQAGFSNFAAIVGPAISGVVDSFVGMWNAAQPLISILSDALMPVFQILGSFLGGVVKGALMGVSFAFDAVKVAIQLVTPIVDLLVQGLNFVQPVLSVIAEWIGVAIGMFGNLGTAGQGLSAFIKSAWTNIQTAISTAGTIISTVIDYIKLAFSGAGSAVGVLKNIFSLAWMAMGDAINVAKGIISSVINGIKSAFSSFSSLVSSVGSAVNGVINSISSTIRGLANIDISGAGAAIMNGFLNGLKSAWGAVKSFVGGIANWIAEHKGPISYDRVLLKPAGKAIMGGLNTSLIDGFKEVKSNVSGMADDLAGTMTGKSLSLGIDAKPSITADDLLSSNISTKTTVGSATSDLSLFFVKVLALLQDILDKNTDVYLDKEKVSAILYEEFAKIMAREGLA
ncbi:minor tail protein [Streptococcus phage Javan155]|nr:minor tail protein [Streptococcus phage Javan155]QBX23637.1 minor tail protein [Streptococcus phage Javan144]